MRCSFIKCLSKHVLSCRLIGRETDEKGPRDKYLGAEIVG